MGRLLVRKVDDTVIARLKAQARRRGVSLEQRLRDILADAAGPDRGEVLAALARSRAMTPRRRRTRAEDVIREVRDAE